MTCHYLLEQILTEEQRAGFKWAAELLYEHQCPGADEWFDELVQRHPKVMVALAVASFDQIPDHFVRGWSPKEYAIAFETYLNLAGRFSRIEV